MVNVTLCIFYYQKKPQTKQIKTIQHLTQLSKRAFYFITDSELLTVPCDS